MQRFAEASAAHKVSPRALVPNCAKHTQQSEVKGSVAPKTTIKQRHKLHPPVTIPFVAICLCLVIYQMH